MSNNLDLDQVAENQALKEVTINTATGQLDAALTEGLSVNVTAGNASLTNSQYRRMIHAVVTGATTAGRTVTLPSIKKLLIISSDSTNTQSFDVVKGSTVLTMAIGATALLYTDGTTNGLLVVSQSAVAAPKPYDVATFCAGSPVASEKLLQFNYVRSVDLPANLVGSRVTAGTAATAQTDFDVQKIGTGSIGTIRFAIGGTVATFVGFGANTFAINDRLAIIAPATPDATLADIAFTLAGTQN